LIELPFAGSSFYNYIMADRNAEGDVIMDKNTIIEMVNSIDDQDAIEYLYVIVLDAYQSCYESTLKRSPVAKDSVS